MRLSKANKYLHATYKQAFRGYNLIDCRKADDLNL